MAAAGGSRWGYFGRPVAGNGAGFAEMRQFGKPFITAHVCGFHVLLVAIVLHIAGVIAAEAREKNGLVSAMFTGSKVISKPPVDE